MDFDRHTTNLAVKRILDALIQELPGYRWERICSFSDGQGHTVVEVSLYRKGGSLLAARLSYHVESGRLLDYHYPAHEGVPPENVVDLLLDIHNTEKAKNSGNF
jgi:hypothetical protein